MKYLQYPLGWAFQILSVISSLVITVMAYAAAFGNGIVGYPAGEKFYAFLSPICHQFPTRSFCAHGHPLGICARCLGGYSGILIAALLWNKIASNTSILKIYAVALTLFFFAVLEALIGLNDGNYWRFVSGFTGGAGALLTAMSAIRMLENSIYVIFTQKKWRNQNV